MVEEITGEVELIKRNTMIRKKRIIGISLGLWVSAELIRIKYLKYPG